MDAVVNATSADVCCDKKPDKPVGGVMPGGGVDVPDNKPEARSCSSNGRADGGMSGGTWTGALTGAGVA